jgi:HAE1 family hydrophobic/amphiphilic exporter-1
MGKHEKVDYEAEMKADYVHRELSEDGFTETLRLKYNNLN